MNEYEQNLVEYEQGVIDDALEVYRRSLVPSTFGGDTMTTELAVRRALAFAVQRVQGDMY